MPALKGTPAILVRMSRNEFDAAHEEASARGVSLNELLRDLLRRARRDRLSRREVNPGVP